VAPNYGDIRVRNNPYHENENPYHPLSPEAQAWARGVADGASVVAATPERTDAREWGRAIAFVMIGLILALGLGVLR
jgi:hypothetical protein